MSWRGQKFPLVPGSSPGKPGTGPGRTTFTAPAGFRDSPEPALAVGEVVSSTFTVRRELNRGESASSFEAWDMLIERPVALRVAWRDPGAPSLVADARRCATVGGGPGAAVFAVGNHRGVEYVAGELLTGVTVRDQLRAAVGVDGRFAPAELLELLQQVTRAVVAVHEAGFAIGDLAPETVLRLGARVVFGRMSLGQVDAVGATGTCFAPEVITGARSASDPAAAAAIDLYGLGALAHELATGAPLFAADTVKAVSFGHVHHRPPTLGELRADLPVELSDLVAELLAKDPLARPLDAATVLAQLDVIAERAVAGRRAVRVLIVDDDADHVRTLWSVVRRAHPRSQVDAARDGREAATKLTRDRPELVLIDGALGMVNPGMNALELIMYARGLDEVAGSALVVIGDNIAERDAAMLRQFGARLVSARGRLPEAVAGLVREVAAAPRVSAVRRSVTG